MPHKRFLMAAQSERTVYGRVGFPLLSVISTQPASLPRRTKPDTSSARPSRLALPARQTQIAHTRVDLPVPAAHSGGFNRSFGWQ
jgi:hypothetical protein